MADLINAARALSVPFEIGADGTYVHFAGKGEAVYVVRNAWRGGFTVHVVADDYRTQVGHYPTAEEAVAAAAELVARPYSAGPAVPRQLRPLRNAS